jgi:putative RNA 2'-phosphotransferase
MSKDQKKRISKFLSLILRHKPDSIGIKLDKQGWVDIDELIEKSKHKYDLTREVIEEVVRDNDKRRFAIGGDRIRASQGHSIGVDLGLNPKIPPSQLYHGTATKFTDSIFKKGLVKGNRDHVHLSENPDTAEKVGVRHGKLAMLLIDTFRMHKDGLKFYLSDNGVWLTDHVPVKYIKRKD